MLIGGTVTVIKTAYMFSQMRRKPVMLSTTDWHNYTLEVCYISCHLSTLLVAK